MTGLDPPVVRAACTLFAALIRILPGRFRRGYADDIEVEFVDEAREAYRAGGTSAVFRATVNGSWDVLRSALDVRWRLAHTRGRWQAAREADMKTLTRTERHDGNDGCRPRRARSGHAGRRDTWRDRRSRSGAGHLRTFSTAELVARSTAIPLFRAQVLAALAVVALGLAVIGVYGVLSFFVAQRRREIGIRLALGATARGMTRFVLRTGLSATAIGCGLGVLASLPLMKLLREQLFEVSPSDPVALILAPGLLLVTAFLACYVPARRATRLEPASAIKPD